MNEANEMVTENVETVASATEPGQTGEASVVAVPPLDEAEIDFDKMLANAGVPA